jgi:hypothetical protein
MDARSDRWFSSRSSLPSRFGLATALAVSSALLLGATAPALAAWNLFPKGAVTNLQRTQDQRLFISIQGGIQTQIIQPSFMGPAADFGLIVPTPAVPDFSDEVADDFFDQLELLTSPPPANSGLTPTASPDGGSIQGPPDRGAEVVEEALIGMYKARVVQANTSDDLLQWLQQNDFAYDPSATDVLKYYVDNHWFFVALEINLPTVSDGSNGSGGMIAHMQPLVIRFPSDHVILPMRMAYLQGNDTFTWTLYLDTSVQVKNAVFRLGGEDKGALTMPTADYQSDSLSANALANYAQVLSPQILAGDHLARLTVPLQYGDVQGDLVFNLVTTSGPGDEAVTPVSGSGCSVAMGSSTGAAEEQAAGATGLLLLIGAVVAAAARRRRG